MNRSVQDSTGVISRFHRLLVGTAIFAGLIITATTFSVRKHLWVDDILYGFHAEASQHIGDMNRELLQIQLILERVNRGQLDSHKQHHLGTSFYILTQRANELFDLSKQYNVPSFQSPYAQLKTELAPIMDMHVFTEDAFCSTVSVEQIQRIILKLEQIKKLHAIASKKLSENASKQQNRDLLLIGIFLAIFTLLFGEFVRRLLSDIREIIRSKADAEQTLFEEKKLLSTTLSSIGDGVITTDAEGFVRMLNPVAERLTGWSTADAKGTSVKTVFSVIDAHTRKPIENPIDKVLARGEIVHFSNHTTLVTKDGKEYQITDSTAPIRDGEKNGEIQGMVLVFKDVTEQYALREQANESRRLLAALMDFSPAIIQVRDLDARYLLVNRQFEHVYDRNRDDIIGNTPWKLFRRELAERMQVEDNTVINSGNQIEIEETVTCRDGVLEFITVKFPLLNSDSKTYAVCSISTDITERKRAEEKILYQAHFDQLTDLPNRFLSLDRLSHMLSKVERNNQFLALLFIDLDDFKKVNDTLGHESGDKLLKQAADRLSSVIRKSDTVGRLGGDEFIVILGELDDPTNARPVIEKVLARFQQAFIVDCREMLITTSIGVAIYPTDGDSPSQLLKSADSAMYHAKARGRNTYSFFTEAMNRLASRRLLVEEQLYGALARGEFSVVYQPIISIKKSETIGVEALLRWENSVLGIVHPDEFIPILEQTGMILKLGKFVLEEGLRNVVHWRELFNDDFQVAVNFSPSQFRDPELVEFIQRSLAKHDVPGKCLELEITEGALLTRNSDLMEVLEAITRTGIRIVMDDFGTGYSSLSYLRNYPFNMLKIDRSFIRDLTVDPAGKALVRATVSMAGALGLKVIAEGVEMKEQLVYLAEIGCNYAQGYYISKPLAGEALSEYLKSSNMNRPGLANL